MPIYAFACSACGHHFDRLQKLSDPDPAACPECGADAVKRQLTAPSFRLSGSGWYETDFKKDGDKKRNLTEKAEGVSGSDGCKAEAKSDAKPAESKPTESKPADSKPAGSNRADSKGAEAKPAAKPAKAEPAAAAKPPSGTP
jgi:putative FmdB family regulatory protein